MSSRADADIMVTSDGLLDMASQYLAHHDPKDPLASPVYGDFRGLPPLLLLVGGDEVLLDDAVRVAVAAGTGDTDATLYIGAGMQHVWPTWRALPEADARDRHDRVVDLTARGSGARRLTVARRERGHRHRRNEEAERGQRFLHGDHVAGAPRFGGRVPLDRIFVCEEAHECGDDKHQAQHRHQALSPWSGTRGVAARWRP